MKRTNQGIAKGVLVLMSVAMISAAVSMSLAADRHTSTAFQGAKVNGGTVTHMTKDNKSMLVLSDDFVAPGTPDPHWQIVDSKGNVYLLDRLMIKTLTGGSEVKKTITVPAYVSDVAKVQIWCAWAEALLGEASFSSPVK